jgi:hypothetical protein
LTSLTEHSLDHAGCWFLHSGIQEPGGGVARYYQSDSGTNRPVSNEITGYAASAFAYLNSLTGAPEYLDAAVRAARFLTREAWNRASSAFPFEPGSDRAYFFDGGIIVRGLLAAWRATGKEEFRDRASEAALSLAFDFLGDGLFHPVIVLPEKQPLPEEPRWSRRPGCYQLKSAVAWLEVARLREADPEGPKATFNTVLAYSLATHESFLNDERDHERLMDRLHAYCYFLEGLLWALEYPEARSALSSGIERTGDLLREIAPQFERSDVSAQLLRLRLIASHLDAVPLDAVAAREEAQRAASFQIAGDDRRLRGGFWFGRKGGNMLPFANPVSTAFAMQALALWRDHQAGRWSFELPQLI